MCRPDLVGFINGLTLVVIELKREACCEAPREAVGQRFATGRSGAALRLAGPMSVLRYRLELVFPQAGCGVTEVRRVGSKALAGGFIGWMLLQDSVPARDLLFQVRDALLHPTDALNGHFLL